MSQQARKIDFEDGRLERAYEPRSNGIIEEWIPEMLKATQGNMQQSGNLCHMRQLGVIAIQKNSSAKHDQYYWRCVDCREEECNEDFNQVSTLLYKANYNRGRMLNRPQIWVFGMLERGFNKVSL
ncbi:unnamed protein product [Caenorhabditis nigoni]